MIPLVVKSTDPLAVEKSINILKKGGVIVYPTDTLYGFGVDANNNYAICLLYTSDAADEV